VGYPTCAYRPQLRQEDTIAKRALDKYKGRLTAEQIAEGINAASRNAVRLVGDADLLLESERFPSAAALAILAIEEAGKVAILRELSVAQEDDKALDNCWRDYRRHTKKNAAWLLPQLMAEGARSLDDFRPLFGKNADHPFLLDNVKQISIYTDCLGDAHWSTPADAINGDLSKTLVQIARMFAKDSDVTSKEIELWVKHMRPYLRSGEVIDYDKAKQAMLDWHADMQEHGLATYGAEEWEAFLNPEPRS
jgi:AbiV family abortive infection protein